MNTIEDLKHELTQYEAAAAEWDRRRLAGEPVQAGYPSHDKMRDMALNACIELRDAIADAEADEAAAGEH